MIINKWQRKKAELNWFENFKPKVNLNHNSYIDNDTSNNTAEAGINKETAAYICKDYVSLSKPRW